MLNTEKQEVINVLLTLNQHISDHISIGYQTWVKEVNQNLEGLTQSTSNYAKCLAESLTDDIKRVRKCLSLIFNDGGNREENDFKDNSDFGPIVFGPENFCEYSNTNEIQYPIHSQRVENVYEAYDQNVNSSYSNTDDVFAPPEYYGMYHYYGYDDQECCYFDPVNNGAIVPQTPPINAYYDNVIYDEPSQYFDSNSFPNHPYTTYTSFDCNSEICNCCTNCSNCLQCLNLMYADEQVKLYTLNDNNNVKEIDISNVTDELQENCKDCEVGHEDEKKFNDVPLEAEKGATKNDLNDKLACDEKEEKPKRKKKLISRYKPADFHDVYQMTEDSLGKGSCGSVYICKNVKTQKEYAVKVIEKGLASHPRSKILKEIEMFHHCHGHPNIVELIEYFEDENYFYLVFEKLDGGELLKQIERHGKFTEIEASEVIRDLAKGLKFIHDKGIAHRDLKPQNILCASANKITPVKICDLDLGSGIRINSQGGSPLSTPVLRSPVGTFEFMAPEVVELWMDDTDLDLQYDKSCDLWSLGVIMYILLCGYPPYIMNCGERNCAWNGNSSCDQCLHQLFDCIHDGELKFPESEWSSVSESAKDLVEKLLAKRGERWSADMVLDHPWIKCEQCDQELSTSKNLASEEVAETVANYADSAMKIHRIVVQHTSSNFKNELDSCAQNEKMSRKQSKDNAFQDEPQYDFKTATNGRTKNEMKFQCDISESLLYKRRKTKNALNMAPAG